MRISVGEHLLKGKSYLTSITTAFANGYTAAQIFVKVPQSGADIKFAEGEKAEIKKFCKEHNFKLFVHSTYSTLVCPKSNVEKNKKLILDQLRACDEIGARGLVIHLHKYTPDQIAQSLHSMLHGEKYKTRIILEMPGVIPTPNTTYETPEKLGRMIDALEKYFGRGVNKFGICIDTSHVFCGGLDMADYDFVKNYLKQLDDERLNSWIDLIHLNGCATEIGSHKDIHAIPFSTQDKIWGGKHFKKSSFTLWLEWIKKNNATAIFEIAGHSAEADVAAMEKLMDHITDW